MNDLDKNTAYEKAKKRVKDEKGFYSHLTAFIIINIILPILRGKFIDFAKPHVENNEGFMEWINWHTIGTPILWGIGLTIHGLWVFKRNLFQGNLFENMIFSKKWEEQKIKEFMEDEDF